MAEIIAHLTLDTYRKNRIPPLVVPQGDYGARYIRANITNHGTPVTVESTAAVSIVANRSGDGESEAFSGEVNADGSVTVPVPQWLLEYTDDVICHVVVTGSGYQYSTNGFIIEPQEKDNPTSISEDDPNVDLITEVLANENARVAAETARAEAETERVSNEDTRVSNETTRQTAEEERIANEAARVAAETTRESKFNSWEADIASLPSFDARITANSKRISNIEAGLPASRWSVDSSTAYQKDVPSNALPYAAVGMIGGMSYKSKNLFIPSIVNKTSLGMNFSYYNGYVQLSGTKASGNNVISVQEPNITLPAGTYTVSCKMVSGSITAAADFDGVYFGINNNTYLQRTTPAVAAIGTIGSRVITFTQATTITSFDITPGYAGIGTVFNDALFEMQFEAGDTVTDYQEGFDGLRDAPVTEIKSVGVNLIPYPYVDTSAGGYGVTFTVNADGSVSAKGTANGGNSTIYLVKNLKLSAGTYFISDKESKSDIRGYFVNSSGNTVYLGKGTITFTQDVVVTLYIVVLNGSTVDYTSYPMLNKGSTALPYTPYVENTLAIPSDVQALDGYGQGIPDTDYYNFIDWRPEDGVTDWHKKVAKIVFDGTETWEIQGSSEKVANLYFKLPNVGKAQELVMMSYGSYNVNAGSTNTALCDVYKINSTGVNLLLDVDITKFATVEAWKVYLAEQYSNGTPVVVVYALKFPVITDISDLLPNDNLISVEGGGTITFENEYGYDVPSEVTYQIDPNAETTEEVSA